MTTIRAILFTSALLLSAGVTSAFAQDDADVLTFAEISTGGNYSVSCATGATLSETVTIPSDYNDRPVSLIAKDAFKGHTEIKHVVIENDIEIGESAFQGCTNLESVEVNGFIVNVGKSAFINCEKLSSITLSEGLDAIGNSAFGGCKSLSKLVLPTSLRWIDQNAFSASGITSLSIPKGVEHISSLAFTACSSLKKVYIEEGCKLDTIHYGLFLGCDALTEIHVGEGVKVIEDMAFFNSSNLKSVTLPKSIVSIGSNVFQLLKNLETVKLYAAHPKVSSNSFTNQSASTKLYVPDPQNYSDFAADFKGGIEKLYAFTDEGYAITATDATGATELFRALADTEWRYLNANAEMKNDVAFAPRELNIDTLSAGDIFSVVDNIPTIKSYNGKLHGATISNMVASSAGLFGLLDVNAEIDGLNFEDAVIYVDPTDSETYETKGNDVTIHILAKENRGKVTNFGFSGDIIVDEELAAGKEISVCAVNEMGDEAEINGFIHIGQLLTTGNTKRCITIKQNLGVKRPPGKRTKIATSKSLATNKSLTTFDFDNPDLQDYVCAFTDEEFASGVVAYWLNFSGPGFTGDYTGYWAQGKKVPVPATVKSGVSNSLQKVDYGDTDTDHLTSAPLFANNGSEITIAYDQKPSSVTIGDDEYTAFGNRSMTVTFDSEKPISISFNKSTTPTIDNQPAQKVDVRTSGKTVTVTGQPAGTEIRLFALTGQQVAATKGQSVTVGVAGLYVLKVGGSTQMVQLK